MAKKKGTRNRDKKSSPTDEGEKSLDDMTKTELQEFAKALEMEKGVEINKSAKKADLLEEIKSHVDGEIPKDGIELADAVSEVIGDKDGFKPTKKMKTQLLKWTADGYDVKELEDLIESGSGSEVKDRFTEFEKAIDDIDKIKAELDEMDLTEHKGDVKELNDLLANPNKAEEAKAKFEELKLSKRAAVMKKELDKMVLPSMKDRVNALKVKIDTLENLDALQKELDQLKVEYKESYFVEGIVSDVKPDKPAEPGRPQVQTKRVTREPKRAVPMIVKDIFLLYKDGRFISHHTSRPVSKEQQNQLFADLKTGRNYLRSPKYLPQKINTIAAPGRNIIVQSGKFTVVVLIAEGDVNPWTERIIGKVLTLMEKEDLADLRAWNGDVASLKSSGKYMQALLFACMKLAKGKKA